MTKPAAGARVAMYLRISSDRDGDALGVQRQEDDCRERVEREGWSVTSVYRDNDVGASSKSGKKRPEYQKMIERAKRREVDVILAYSTSRLTRRPLEYEELIQLSERFGVVIRTIVSGDDDLSTADGQFVARIKAAQDAAESARISERVSRKALSNAQAGKFGGGRRPFGFESDGVTVRESEAGEIRKATRAILRGDSLRSIARDLNSREVMTTAGKTWTPVAVRELLRRPRNAGLVKYSPITRDEEGRRIHNRSADSFSTASWEPIVSNDERLAVVAILADPRRKTSPGNQPRYLGSSIYLCGVCGAKMRTMATANRATRYVCNDKQGTGGNHLSRNAEKVDAVVNDAAIEWLVYFIGVNKLAGEKKRSVDPNWQAMTSELSAVQQRRKDVQSDYAEGYMDQVEFRATVDRLRQREAELNEKMVSGPVMSVEMFPRIEKPDEVAPWWHRRDIETKRKLLTATLSVTILPTERRGTKTFDPDSVRIEAMKDPATVLHR